jgi:hypothetical protein
MELCYKGRQCKCSSSDDVVNDLMYARYQMLDGRTVTSSHRDATRWSVREVTGDCIVELVDSRAFEGLSVGLIVS